MPPIVDGVRRIYPRATRTEGRIEESWQLCQITAYTQMNDDDDRGRGNGERGTGNSPMLGTIATGAWGARAEAFLRLRYRRRSRKAKGRSRIRTGSIWGPSIMHQRRVPWGHASAATASRRPRPAIALYGRSPFRLRPPPCANSDASSSSSPLSASSSSMSPVVFCVSPCRLTERVVMSNSRLRPHAGCYIGVCVSA